MGELYDFQQIAGAEQPEMDTLDGLYRNLHKDFSIFTLTEYGAKRWEDILGFPSGKGTELSERRSKIQLKYLSRLPYTYKSLVRYLAQVTHALDPAGGAAISPDVMEGFYVTLDPGAYKLAVEVESPYESILAGITGELREMIPANLILQTAVTKYETAGIQLGCALQVSDDLYF